MGVHVSPCPKSPSHLPPHPISLSCPSALALSALFHASNLDWSSISHMVIYMIQCYSLKSSHLHLLPQSPKVCSLYLCLFFCLAYKDFSGGSDGKVSFYNVEDLGSTPGLGISSGEGNGEPLQYSCLENPMDRGAW